MDFKQCEWTAARSWAQRFTAKRSPFSFTYNQIPSSSFLPDWQASAVPDDSTPELTCTKFLQQDRNSGLAICAEVTEYCDFPAVEWVLKLQNNGKEDTPIIADLRALDALIPLAKEASCVLRYSLGARCQPEDFMPVETELPLLRRYHFQPGGGRSSSEILPFFNFDFGGEGIILAIGWTGEWAVDFTRKDNGELQIQSGMACTHLKLYPGETIRTPKILLLFWQGDRMRGHNLLRRFILKHHRPNVNGKPILGPLCNMNWGATSAAVHLDNIQKIIDHDLPFEYYWIDAEWFGNGSWPANTGNWQVKADLYPAGFRPLSEKLHNSGRKLLLWMEYERVVANSSWAQECAPWLLHIPASAAITWADYGGHLPPHEWAAMESRRNQLGPGDALFNLGDPDGRRFMIDFISRMISDCGIDCLRQDSNIAQLEYWRHNDLPDRQGITEIRYVEGQYALWDELLARHPNLTIDNCSSGGRRLDLESLSRTTPLWRTDFSVGFGGNPTAVQCQTYGILYWVPLNGTGGGYLDKFNNYEVRSRMCAAWVVGLHGQGDAAQQPLPENYPFDHAKKLLEEYLAIREYFLGDYYPLTDYSLNSDVWMVYQLDRPEQGDGLVVALKRSHSPFAQGRFQLHVPSTESEYEVVNLDTGVTWLVSSAKLQEDGLEIVLENTPASALIKYRQVSAHR